MIGAVTSAVGMLENGIAARVGREIVIIDAEAAGDGVGDDDAMVGVGDEADHVDDASVLWSSGG